MRLSYRGAAAVAVAALAVPALAAVPAGAAAPRARLAGSTPAWATPGNARGNAATGTSVTVSLRLASPDAAGAEAFATAVSTPGTAEYGHYLTPAQYKARFAASDSTVAKVEKWVRSAHLSVVTVSPTNATLTVRGTVGQLQSAFDTTIKKYSHSGKTLRAPASVLSLPSDLAGVVTGVSGLTQTVAKPGATTQAPPPAGFVNPPICSSYYGQKSETSIPANVSKTPPPAYGKTQPLVVCGYTPKQLRAAYGTALPVAAGLNGKGVTVAIVDAYNAPTILADANRYSRNRGEPTFKAGQFSEVNLQPKEFGYDDTVNGDQCGEQGWYGEETLDVEAVHGMAPGANVEYVGGTSCDDFALNAAVQTIVDSHSASIVTNSYGDLGEDLPADDIAANHATFVQAATEGIGVFFSSGDDGDEVALDGAKAVDYPSSDPFVTAVGGTSLAIGRTGKRQFELGWETDTTTLNQTTDQWNPAPPGVFQAGGGGGVSTLFDQPSYQKGVVPASISGGPNAKDGKGRTIPDLAAVGDPNTGFLVGETQTFLDGSVKYGEYRIGGTSLSSPLTAGIVALANQAGHRSTGFINPRLYRLSGTPALYDPSSSNRTTAVVRVNYNNNDNPSDGYNTVLRTFNQKTTIFIRPGYDDVTGVGTPNGLAFLAGLAIR